MRLLGQRTVRPMSPRLAAIRILGEHVDAGRAGLDPYDPALFVVNASRLERSFIARALELVGCVLTEVPRPNGGYRFRAVLESDVRDALGLDGPEPAVMRDEPLASRAVLHQVPVLGCRPTLTLISDGPDRMAQQAGAAGSSSFDAAPVPESERSIH